MSEFKSAALEKWQYRDPSLVAERKEAQSCKGCKFEKVEKLFGVKINLCKKGKPHGRKCRNFVPANDA